MAHLEGRNRSSGRVSRPGTYSRDVESGAVLLFKTKELSAGAAAEFAEVDRFRFAAECQKHGVPLVDYPTDDLYKELEALRQ